MIFYGYVVDVEEDVTDYANCSVTQKIEAVCATEAYGKLESLRAHWNDSLVLEDAKGKIICTDTDDNVGWLLDHYDKQHHVSFEDRLARAVAQADKETIQMMREFLKKHDPHFATDAYLDGLSAEAMKAEYLEVRKCVMDSERDVGDDWAQRRESLAVENLGFHG